MLQSGGLTGRVERIRAGLRDDDRASFDAELGRALNSIGEAENLQPFDHVIEAWSRVVLTLELAGTAWAAMEERLRRGDEPTWNSEPRYRLLQTSEFSSLATGLSDKDRVSLSEMSELLVRDPLPTGDSGLAIEPFGALPNTYSAPFGAGLLIYVVPPHKQIVGLVLIYQPLAVWGWGKNDLSTLADGTLTSRSVPVKALGVTTGRSISVGAHYSLYVDDLTSKVWAWGVNDFGQLGDGTTTDRNLPVQLAGLSNIRYVSAHGYHSMAVKYDGTVWEWGVRTPAPTTSVPTEVPGLVDVQDIASGWFHSIALKSDGTVWAWGINISGEVGDGTTTFRPSPVQVSGLTDVTAIAAWDGHSMALKADGTVWAWGENDYAELGDGTTINRSLPVQVGGLPGAATAIAISRHSLVVLADGSVWAWGHNVAGQLGDGMTYMSRPAPAPVSGLSGVIRVAAGYNYSLARTDNGWVWGWGDNAFGKLGDGTTTDRRTPVPVTNLTRVRSIAAGYYHSLALVAP